MPYSRNQEMKLIIKMRKHIRETLPENIQTRVTYQTKTLSTKFHVKHEREFYHQSNWVYYGMCLNKTSEEDYIVEIDRRIIEIIIDHNKRDKNLHIPKHSRGEYHCSLWDKDFKVLGSSPSSQLELMSNIKLQFH